MAVPHTGAGRRLFTEIGLIRKAHLPVVTRLNHVDRPTGRTAPRGVEGSE
jgi:hypothetical protein